MPHNHPSFSCYKYHKCKCEGCIAEYRKFYEANAEVLRERAKAWRLNNPEKFREQKRKAHARNPEASKRRFERWVENEANRERTRERSRAWYLANPEKAKLHAMTRRARKKGAEGAITQDDIRFLEESYGRQCLKCSSTQEPLHVDHIVPLVKGGSNLRDNLQLLCARCNLSKHDKVADYRPKLDAS